MLKRFKNYLLEMAIPLSKYKAIIKRVKPNFDIRQKYFEIFSHYDTGPRKGKKPYRIYFPLKVDKKTEVQKYYIIISSLNNFLESLYKKGLIKDKWEFEDFILGILKNDKGKIIKFNKLLNKTLKQLNKKAKKIVDEKTFLDIYCKNRDFSKSNIDYILTDINNFIINRAQHKNIPIKELNHETILYYHTLYIMKAFENMPIRKIIGKNKHTIIISHHPYDVAGMSTKRGWTSCMDLYGGVNKHYVYNEIENGTIIAYIVKDKDFNIEKPVGRLLIKPYINYSNNSEFILVPEQTVYGTDISGFRKFVEKWVQEVNKKYLNYKETKLYCLAPGSYDDGMGRIFNIENVDENTIEEIDILELDSEEIFSIPPEILIKHPDFTNLPEVIITDVINIIDYIEPDILADLYYKGIVEYDGIFSWADKTYKYFRNFLYEFKRYYSYAAEDFAALIRETEADQYLHLNTTEWKKIFDEFFPDEEIMKLMEHYFENNTSFVKAIMEYFIKNKIFKKIDEKDYKNIDEHFMKHVFLNNIDELILAMNKKDFEVFVYSAINEFLQWNNMKDFDEYYISSKATQKVIDEFLDEEMVNDIISHWSWFVGNLDLYLNNGKVKLTPKNIEIVMYLYSQDYTRELTSYGTGDAIRECIEKMTDAERKTLYLRVSSAHWYDKEMQEEFPILDE